MREAADEIERLRCVILKDESISELIVGGPACPICSFEGGHYPDCKQKGK